MMIFPELFSLHSYRFYIASLAVSRLRDDVQVSCAPGPYLLARAAVAAAATATHAFGAVLLPDKCH